MTIILTGNTEVLNRPSSQWPMIQPWHRGGGVPALPSGAREAFREFSKGEKNLRSELEIGLVVNAAKSENVS